VSGKPIKFVGEGEGMSALEPFYPDRMASRILGMGDVLTFVEKAQEVVREGCEIGLSFHVYFFVTQVPELDHMKISTWGWCHALFF